MSEAEASSEHAEGSSGANVGGAIFKNPVGVRASPSRLSITEFEKLLDQYPCLTRYNAVLPSGDQRAHRPPPGKVAFYKSYLTCSSLRLPLTPFYLKVLHHYRIGVAQMQPIGLGKVVLFEMVSAALGYPRSLFMFRKMFKLVKKGDWFSFESRGEGLVSNAPATVKFWRFDYFFVDSSFIPPDMRSVLVGWRDGSITKVNKKLNQLPDESLINARRWARLRAITIPYQSYTVEQEGILAMVGISQDWEWTKIPVIIKKSTGKPMNLLEGLGEDFEEYEILLESDDRSAIGYYREAREVIPIRPATVVVEDYQVDDSGELQVNGVDNSSLGVSSMPSSAPSSGNHPSTHVLSSMPPSSGDHPSTQAHASPPHACECPEDDHIIIPDDSSPGVGGKRSREDADNPSQKLQKIVSPSSSRLGFPCSTTSGSVVGTGQSAFSGFATCLTFGTTSSSCLARKSSLPTAATAGSSTSSSVGLEPISTRFGPLTHHSFFSDCPPYHCDQLLISHWGEIGDAAVYRMSTEPSSSQNFVSQRIGSTIVPSPISDFNKGLGNCFFVPHSVLRLKDDGQDPAQARAFADSIVPPILLSEGVRRDVDDLARRYDLHAFNSFVSGALMRKGLLRDREQLAGIILELTAKLDEATSTSSKLTEELKQEKDVSANLRRDKEKVEGDYASLRSELDTLAREKKNSDAKSRELVSNLLNVEVGLQHKKTEFENVKSSMQSEIDGLKAELEEERKLKTHLIARVKAKEADLISAIKHRQDTLAAFPDLFKRLLAHPGVKDAFDRFNKASLAFGRHDASYKIKKLAPDLQVSMPYLNSRAFGDMKASGEVVREMNFPILQELVRDLDASIDEILARLAPIPLAA